PDDSVSSVVASDFLPLLSRVIRREPGVSVGRDSTQYHSVDKTESVMSQFDTARSRPLAGGDSNSCSLGRDSNYQMEISDVRHTAARCQAIRYPNVPSFGDADDTIRDESRDLIKIDHKDLMQELSRATKEQTLKRVRPRQTSAIIGSTT